MKREEADRIARSTANFLLIITEVIAEERARMFRLKRYKRRYMRIYIQRRQRKS